MAESEMRMHRAMSDLRARKTYARTEFFSVRPLTTNSAGAVFLAADISQQLTEETMRTSEWHLLGGFAGTLMGRQRRDAPCGTVADHVASMNQRVADSSIQVRGAAGAPRGQVCGVSCAAPWRPRMNT